MPKRVYFDEDARSRALAGAKQIYDAVRVTLGPRGRNVVITNQFGLPVPTHDGVTVAKAIDLPADTEATLGQSAGADMVRIAASKTNDTVGDGTTTATVLAYHIMEAGNKLIAAGYNPMILKRELDRAAAGVLALLPEYVETISGDSAKIKQVATISAGGDEAMGELIADVMKTVGEEGSVTVEQSQGSTITKEVVEGFQIDRGFVSPYMINDPSHNRAVWQNAPILVTDARIGLISDLMPLLELMNAEGHKSLVIVCDDLEGDALQTLVLNTVKGSFQTLAIKAPAFGDRRKGILEDIAVLTGATVVSREAGFDLRQANTSMLGRARSVIADRDMTTIVEGQGDQEMILGRIEELKSLAGKATSEFDKEKLEERLAQMAGKVAVIKVGGVSEVEIEEKKFRVDDAVFATKAALAEGIVAGAGVTLVNLATQFAKEGVPGSAGEKLLLDALKQPLVQLMDNSGWSGELALREVERSGKVGFGFSVDDPNKLIDLKKAGIIDPGKVARETIQNAVSVAGNTLTMGSLVVDLPPHLSGMAEAMRNLPPRQ